MVRVWRIAVVVMLLVAGSIGTAAAQGKGNGGGGNNGGGPGSGATCPSGAAQVVLDPGHGLHTGASTTLADGTVLWEDDLNLQIAELTASYLTYSVALTRYDNTTNPENSERGAVANACGALVFVEIHLNASSDPSVNFTQTFWGKKNKDLSFSTIMIDNIEWLTGDGRVGQFANGGLLHAGMPSTLVEAVFLTSPDEAAQLATPYGPRQQEIAQSIANGISACIQNYDACQ